MEPDLDGAAAFARDLMIRGLAPHLTYHTVEHTAVDVLGAADRLADLEGISDSDRCLLLTAAWFHDLGYTVRAAGHEAISIEIARERLPGFGYSPQDIEVVAAAIEATKLPQTPTIHLAEVLADADLDVLGRDVAWDRNRGLRAEIEAAGGRYTEAEWLDNQIAFVAGHRYFTVSARRTRDAAKATYLDELRAARAAL